MIACPACGARLEGLALSLRLSPRRLERDGMRCPACAGHVPLADALLAQGVFVRHDQLCRWVEGGDPELLRVGRLIFHLPGVLPLSLRTVCFGALPRLVDAEGRAFAGLLPLRPNYIDLVEEIVEAPTLRGGVGAVTVRLRGRASPDRIERPLWGPQSMGLRVSLWPDLPAPWRFFLLGAWRSGEGPALEVGAVGQRAVVLGPGEGAGVRQLEGRPRWVSVVDPGDQAGGCLAVPPVAPRAPTEARAILGVDFGTANTYLAWRQGEDAGRGLLASVRAIPWGDRERTLIDGGPRPDGRASPETWPPRQGFHPDASTFPTALLSRSPTAHLPVDAQRWRLGEDVGLPLLDEGGGPPGYREAEHLVTQLKWAPRTAAGPLPNAAARERYLEWIGLLALANLLCEPGVHLAAVELRWSYPAAFGQEGSHALTSATEAFAAVAARLTAQTGLRVHALRGADEATVAGVGTTSQHAEDVLHIDVGGGTVDTLFTRAAPPGARRVEAWALSSFRFAGDDVFAMLDGAGLFDPSVTADVFARAVRGAPRVSEELGRRLFLTARQEAARGRVALFFGYLVEVAARLIAARLLDGSPIQADDGAYRVSVDLLGNGWGLLGFAQADPVGALQKQLQRRVEALCAAEADRAHPQAGLRRGLRPRVEVVRAADRHPKQAVAHGLLRAADADRSLILRGRGLLGLSTEVGATYPWFLPVGLDHEPSDPRFEGHPPVPRGPRARWRPEADPGFGDWLPDLHDIDPELRGCHAHLCESVLPGPTQDWFVRSALEVALQDVIRPNLHRAEKGGPR